MLNEDRFWQLIGGETSRIGNRLAVVSLLLAVIVFLENSAADVAQTLDQQKSPVVLSYRTLWGLTLFEYTVSKGFALWDSRLLWLAFGFLLLSIPAYWRTNTNIRALSLRVIASPDAVGGAAADELFLRYRALQMPVVIGDILAAMGFFLLVAGASLLAIARFALGSL